MDGDGVRRLGRYRIGDRVRVTWVDWPGTLEWTVWSTWTLVSDNGDRASPIQEHEVIGYDEGTADAASRGASGDPT